MMKIKRIPNPQNMPLLSQGKTNGCGTTSLAMILTYLLGRPVSREEIDSEIRRMDVFTAPGDIVAYAHHVGLKAEMYNNGTWSEVKSRIAEGIPVQALIHADQLGMGYDIKGPHYIAIIGYKTDPVAGEESVLYHDSNGGRNGSSAIAYQLRVSEFERMWARVGFGFKNFFIAIAPEGTQLPAGRDKGVVAVLGTLSGVTNLLNGLNRLYTPYSFRSFVYGIFQVPAGAVQTLVCGVGGLITLGGQWLRKANRLWLIWVFADRFHAFRKRLK
jgi:ABC-type bacteriocin/lantibiotic exporter with double-glycine peptidase domain